MDKLAKGASRVTQVLCVESFQEDFFKLKIILSQHLMGIPNSVLIFCVLHILLGILGIPEGQKIVLYFQELVENGNS